MHINKSIINFIETYFNSKMISFKSRSLKTLAYSFYIVLLDQVSKFLVLSTLGFERSKNIIPYFLNFTLVKIKELHLVFLAILLIFLPLQVF